MLITFSLFWFTYRYQMIYVSYAKAETNGLIFPKAINQLFTGLYFLELCLIGLFFLQKSQAGAFACFPQAIIMIVVFMFTVTYQILINMAFGPLVKYLPITFEDAAVQRDEEFQQAQNSHWQDKDHSFIEQEGSKKVDKPDEQGHQIWPHTDELEPSRNSVSQLQSASHAGRKEKNDAKPIKFIRNTIRTGLDNVSKPIRDFEARVMPTHDLFDTCKRLLAL